MADTRQAFTGLRIIDFTQVLAGPFATQQLAQCRRHQNRTT